MRVVHLLRKYNPEQWGGTETAIQRLLDGLQEHRAQSVVYCPALENEPARDPLRDAGHQVKRFRAFVPILGMSAQRKRQLVSVGGNLMSFDLFSALKREPDAAVMHTHTLGRIGGIARAVARTREIPFVITIHGGVLDLPAQMKKDFNAPVEGWEWGKFFGLIFQSHRLFPEADAIITCNQNEAKLLREKYPNKRIITQPHGVSPETLRQNHRDDALKAFPQIRGKKVLLCVGRVDPVKNQAWLLDQAAQIFQRHPRTMLVFAGSCTDEAYGELIRRKISSLGIEDRVLLTGGLPPNDPALIGLMQEAEVLISPSISETFGLVILEAWAAGTKVLSSRTSGACALVENGRNGWLFDLENPRTFHEQLENALGNSDAAKNVLRQSADQVEKEFSIVALAGRMKKLYEELIQEKHALRDSSRR
jgi:glycosyltransferase involved in cell wall biosynthesis